MGLGETDQAALDAAEQEADRAAGRGDIAAARTMLERIVADAPGRIDSWLKLAAMRRAASDMAGAQEAISGALRVDPLHFVALLSRARMLEGAGDAQEAARAYTRALAQLPADQEIPGPLRPLVDHGRKLSGAYEQRVEATWDRAIAEDPGLSPRQRGRLERFKSNALRRTRTYHSEPTHYHYPGLAEREFHDREDFPWLPLLEAATADIRQECAALLLDRSARAEPYVQYSSDTPVRQWSALNHSLDWTAFHLTQGSRVISENADRCPRTMAVLAAIDQPRIAGRSPNAMFSLLKPRTRIPPHTGIANTRLVCHLPLVVPKDCWFRVGAERREWRVGEAFVFDDTIEHEAANDSDEPRIVFIIDAWHPGLDSAERAAVKRVMEADEAEHGAPL
ncbi:MAG: aspartyl/asparaginyl beta-hydroxylase domain-containing protein [Pseudomonadota bacterium]